MMDNSIDISAFSTKQLLEFMRRIVSELEVRQSNPQFIQTPEPVIPTLSPGRMELIFINNCLSVGTVKSEMKDRWRELYNQYPEWFQSKGYPHTLRGADFDTWKKYFAPRD
jgi:hypothetical protein